MAKPTARMRPNGEHLVKLLDELPQEEIRMIEIGCGYGESTYIFGTHPKVVSLTSVDPFEPYEELPSTNFGEMMSFFLEVQESLGAKSTFIRKRSADAASLLPDGTFDFVYIDGAHDPQSCLSDIRLYVPKLNGTGAIGGHDYKGDGRASSGHFHLWGPRAAVQEAFGDPDRVYPDSSWVVLDPRAKMKG